jgi:N utilization substance protein B
MQALYGFFNAEDESIGKSEKELLFSINHFYELFLYQFLFLTEVFEIARKQIEDSKQKHRPTEQELNPNTRFIENLLLFALSENPKLKSQFEKRKISWIGENEIARRVFNNFKSGSEYEKYMNSVEKDFEKDKEIVAVLFKKYIAEFPPLVQFYEEKNIFWVDDIDIVNHILVKIIRSIKEGAADKTFNELEWSIDDEDREFGVGLFRKVIMSSEKYEKIISEKTINWEVERIAMMDILLMKMAVCELLEFPSIPVKVTLNEYIDLSKMYSTPKSSLFINGILDKLISDFKNASMIKKTGRGLM